MVQNYFDITMHIMRHIVDGFIYIPAVNVETVGYGWVFVVVCLFASLKLIENYVRFELNGNYS